MKMTLQAPDIPSENSPQEILSEFARRGGEAVQEGVRSVLGTEEAYTLSPEYSKRKPSLKRFKRYAGKAFDQPEILSGDMYDHIEVRQEGSSVFVGVAEGHGVSEKGFDYASHQEELSQFLEKGFATVGEERLADILLACALEAIG